MRATLERVRDDAEADAGAETAGPLSPVLLARRQDVVVVVEVVGDVRPGPGTVVGTDADVPEHRP